MLSFDAGAFFHQVTWYLFPRRCYSFGSYDWALGMNSGEDDDGERLATVVARGPRS